MPIITHVEGAKELLLEDGLHAASVLHHRVNPKVRPEFLHAPRRQRHRVEVAAAIASQATLPTVRGHGGQVLAGRPRYEQNGGVQRQVLDKVV